MGLLFGEITGEAKIRYPHMPVLIQEDVCRLKEKEVQESPRGHRSFTCPPQGAPLHHHFIMADMTWELCALRIKAAGQ